MPGKVNPVIPEVVNQVAFEVVGNDVAISMAAEGGQLQLNAFEPIIAHSLFESLAHLTAACETLRSRCVVGITANVEHMRSTVDRSIGLVTALNPLHRLRGGDTARGRGPAFGHRHRLTGLGPRIADSLGPGEDPASGQPDPAVARVGRRTRAAMTVTIGLAQWLPRCHEPDENLRAAQGFIGALADRGCNWVVLPRAVALWV